ncbi:O-antigen ligase family protein [Pirellulaceae bacterium SH449]
MSSYARPSLAQRSHPYGLDAMAHWWSYLLFWGPIGLVVAIVFATTGDLQYAASGGAEVYGEVMTSNIVRQISFLTLGGMGCFLLLTPVANRRISWWLALPCSVMLLYLFASTLWSDEPTTTLKRAMLWACIVLAGFGMGKAWDFRKLCNAIFVITSIFLVGSVLAEAHYRAILNGGEYRFSGIFHPGKQAFNCGLLFLASLTLFLHERKRLFLFIGAIAFGFLIMTKARTGAAATLIAGLLLVWPHLSVRWVVATGILGGWLTVGAVLFAGISGRGIDVGAVATMGRDNESADPTQLTGRWPIWKETLSHVYQRPLLGYGYGAFWTPQRYEVYERRMGWALAHSHSAYIEALINVGLIGMCLGMGIVATGFFASLYWGGFPEYAHARLISAIILLALVSSFTEVAFISEGFEFIALVTSIGSLAFTTPRPRVPIARAREVFS